MACDSRSGHGCSGAVPSSAAQVLWQVGGNVETWNRSTHRAALGLPDLTAAVILPSARGCLPAAQLQRQPEIDLAAQTQAERGVEEGRA